MDSEMDIDVKPDLKPRMDTMLGGGSGSRGFMRRLDKLSQGDRKPKIKTERFEEEGRRSRVGSFSGRSNPVKSRRGKFVMS